MKRPVPFPAVAAAAYGFLLLQASRPVVPEGLTLCPFKLVTGCDCPGCGMGHSLVAAMRGDWAASWCYHPLGMPLALLWTMWLMWGALNMIRGRDFSEGFLPIVRRPGFSCAALIVTFAVYAVRHFPAA